ncbi:type IV pilus assembly protein PilB [Mesonia phycicola]|uniref:Type IV pilus assembly protein PilB n=1 Tax=Mesonia phycicola TaxID=579105 RepID=A0A1M6DL64_9FLAO|nr:GspE/PulE family protein [Mesonia phycicola]SHI73779.1 type IV pilus assembly protein PilB [Mesonia phycicola]
MNLIKEIDLSTEHQQLISGKLAFHYKIIPESKIDNILTLYIANSKKDNHYIEELELILGCSVKFNPVSDEIINKTLSKYYRSNNNEKRDTSFSLNTDFLENLILEAKSLDSSDIHFESFKNNSRIRFRIDGKLIERYKVEKENYLELINKIKIKSRLNITEKRLPQDGRIHYDDFDLRVSILPTLYGEKVVMRILGKDTSNLSIQDLGMEKREYDTYLEGVNSSRGIILISGPTGSGKTTTLYATLKMLNKLNTNILTIEDPIEYTLEGINQVQLNEDIGLTFSSALKTFLRQDPDIIMVGEIRDEKTAQMAIRASLTGHLVLSTIHTNSAIGTVSRLMDMGVPSFLIAETLLISAAQRLIRKLCEKCKVCVPLEGQFKDDFKELKFHYISKGCDTCFHTGYKGRVAIYELFSVNSEVVSKINNGDKLPDYNKSNLKTKAISLITKGVTSIDEVYSILIQDNN